MLRLKPVTLKLPNQPLLVFDPSSTELEWSVDPGSHDKDTNAKVDPN